MGIGAAVGGWRVGMRAFIVLLVGLALVLPAAVLLQQPRGPWSPLWDTLGLTFGMLGTLVVLIGFGMAIWRVLRGE